MIQLDGSVTSSKLYFTSFSNDVAVKSLPFGTDPGILIDPLNITCTQTGSLVTLSADCKTISATTDSGMTYINITSNTMELLSNLITIHNWIPTEVTYTLLCINYFILP